MINQNTPLTFFRLFSPMEGELREADDTGIVGDNTTALTAYETVDYTRYVKKEIRHMPMASNGLVAAIQNEAIRGRIASMFPTVEEYGGRLWGVLEVRTAGRLTSREMKILQDEWISQAKNGWGKSFEEQPIRTPQGELHVLFYNEGPDYSIRMEQELKGGQTKMQVTIVADEHKEKHGYKGAAVELPASWFELDDALQRARVSKGGGYRLQCLTQWPRFLAEYLSFSVDKTLEEINLLAGKISQMDKNQLEIYEGALRIRKKADVDRPISIKELINYAYNLDSFEFYPGVNEDYELGEIVIMGGALDIVDDLPDEVIELLDKRKVGKVLRDTDKGEFTEAGYTFCCSTNWQEVYDGIHLPEQMDVHDGVISLRLKCNDNETHEDNGVWLELPANRDDMEWALASLGMKSFERGVSVEIKSNFLSLVNNFLSNADIEKLNNLAKKIVAFSNSGLLTKYKAAVVADALGDIDMMLDIAENLDCYDFDDNCTSFADYGKKYLQELGVDIDDPAFKDFDFSGYNLRRMEVSGLSFTPYGMVSRNTNHFEQKYTLLEIGMTMQ